jgi:hypothetical protein
MLVQSVERQAAAGDQSQDRVSIADAGRLDGETG